MTPTLAPLVLLALLVVGAAPARGEGPSFMGVRTDAKADPVTQDDDGSKRAAQLPEGVHELKDADFYRMVDLRSKTERKAANVSATPKPWLLIFGRNCPACKHLVEGPLKTLHARVKKMGIKLEIGVLHAHHAPMAFEHFWVEEIPSIVLQNGNVEYTFGRDGGDDSCCLSKKGCDDDDKFKHCWQNLEKNLATFLLDKQVRGPSKKIRQKPKTELDKAFNAFYSIASKLGWKFYFIIGLCLAVSGAFVMTVWTFGQRAAAAKRRSKAE